MEMNASSSALRIAASSPWDAAHIKYYCPHVQTVNVQTVNVQTVNVQTVNAIIFLDINNEKSNTNADTECTVGNVETSADFTT